MEEVLYTSVLNYLSIRQRSEKEIRDYLKQQFAKPQIAKAVQGDAAQIGEKIIARLKSQKFLDDRTFAMSWIRTRMTYRKKGRRLIALELQQKGIPKELIAELLDHPEEEIASDLQNAQAILEKNRRKYETLSKNERLQKAGSMLMRRGYAFDTIRQAIDAVFEK